MIKKTISALSILLAITTVQAKENYEPVVNNYTVSVSCVNECFNLLTVTDNFQRNFVNQCLLSCGASDLDLLDKLAWQDEELNRLESIIEKMKTNKQLGKPFICVE